jgi:AraC family transcriptional regulator of adaptative response/methylated-DNA-[protein]-cysteine methyltransferase
LIQYGFHASPFGECLLAVTERGICGLAFITNSDRQAALTALTQRWRQADMVEDPVRTQPVVDQIFNPQSSADSAPFHLFVNGTNFQIKVWEALLHIPSGRLTTYQSIARSIGMPGAARAVGNAIANNPIPVLIPCHRVIQKMGNFGGYRYGAVRKKALIGWELAQIQRNAHEN